ncbi:protein translocase subunit SecD [Candidatus Kaiserbacteria bacterium]|nr:protein translocase subunit SecD [Candidatus Kaiserbacteria bacterium]USN89005.1 MAG: protein translocase subunit SecD [Candidatus Nomurabacteria bacterium]
MSSKSEQSSAGSAAFLRWFRALVVVGVMVWLASSVYQNATTEDAAHPFKLGLDLAGGSHLVYEADVTGIDQQDVPDLMNVLRDVIERRVNVFGVSEPIVQIESSSFVTDEPKQRLVVELPGVTDVGEAVAEIGKTPLLEFKLYSEELAQQQAALESLGSLSSSTASSGAVIGTVKVNGEEIDTTADTEGDEPFIDTGLTGRYLETATLAFAGANSGQLANEPMVQVKFTDEGAALFEQITSEHVGEQLGIFLDGELLSAPRINERISGGTAVISGNFTPDEARALAQNLSFGALPVPIVLQSTQTIGASLGSEVLGHGMEAGMLGLTFVIAFMLLWYRLPGLVAGAALLSYVVLMLALFQLVPVTLTAAGLAGFVLSLGMAVDANVLVFERMKEEFRHGESSRLAAQSGFARAWSAIRDGNITSLLSAIILFWFGTSMVKGFALVFGMGVLVSMFSALVVTRTLLIALPEVRRERGGIMAFLFGSGFSK